VTRGMMMLSVCVQSVKTYVAKVLSDLNHFSFLYLDDKEKSWRYRTFTGLFMLRWNFLNLLHSVSNGHILIR